MEFIEDINFFSFISKDCGKSAVRTSRIVGGNDAYFGQFPWQVRFLNLKSFN